MVNPPSTTQLSSSPKMKQTTHHRPNRWLLHASVGVVIGVLSCIGSKLYSAPVQLVFSHLDKSEPLRIDSLRYKNGADEAYSSTRLSYLVSGITLQGKGGLQSVDSQTVGWIDAAKSRNRMTLPDVPPGPYRSLTFHIGVDPQRNHANPAQYTANHPLNPNLNNLHWDWQGGYIFMALEGHWRRPGEVTPGGYAYHFANDHNRTAITISGDFEIGGETEIIVGVDLSAILDGLSFGSDGATTHSQDGDPISIRIKKNLPSAFQLLKVSDGLQMPPQPPIAPIDLPQSPTPFPISLPRHVPIPKLPLDNPLIAERVALGERLFHEKALSRTRAISCASCHQGPAMSDPRTFSPGVDGKHGHRHSMPLFNLAWKESFFWDGRAPSLREQVLIPIEDPLEMDDTLENVISKLKDEPGYPELFRKAFGSGEITPLNIGLALENFLLTQLSFDSKFDRSLKGKASLTAEEQRGFELFFTESEPRLDRRGADCFHCHGGTLFSDHGFHNTGLATTSDFGLEGTTGKATDRFKFSTPSLRNVALTAPYMHDGRFATLEEVIEHYNNPIESSLTLDPNLAKHPQGLGLSDEDQAALIAFLKTLSDPALATP